MNFMETAGQCGPSMNFPVVEDHFRLLPEQGLFVLALRMKLHTQILHEIMLEYDGMKRLS